MNGVQINGQSNPIAAHGMLSPQNRNEVGKHGGRDVVVNSQPAATVSLGMHPPSYKEVMAQDQRVQQSTAVLHMTLLEASRLSSQPRHPTREERCCHSFCGNGTCGDLAAYCVVACCGLLCSLIRGC